MRRLLLFASALLLVLLALVVVDAASMQADPVPTTATSKPTATTPPPPPQAVEKSTTKIDTQTTAKADTTTSSPTSTTTKPTSKPTKPKKSEDPDPAPVPPPGAIKKADQLVVPSHAELSASDPENKPLKFLTPQAKEAQQKLASLSKLATSTLAPKPSAELSSDWLLEFQKKLDAMSEKNGKGMTDEEIESSSDPASKTPDSKTAAALLLRQLSRTLSRSRSTLRQVESGAFTQADLTELKLKTRALRKASEKIQHAKVIKSTETEKDGTPILGEEKLEPIKLGVIALADAQPVKKKGSYAEVLKEHKAKISPSAIPSLTSSVVSPLTSSLPPYAPSTPVMNRNFPSQLRPSQLNGLPPTPNQSSLTPQQIAGLMAQNQQQQQQQQQILGQSIPQPLASPLVPQLPNMPQLGAGGAIQQQPRSMLQVSHSASAASSTELPVGVLGDGHAAELLKTIDTLMQTPSSNYKGQVNNQGQLCAGCEPIILNTDSPLSDNDLKLLHAQHSGLVLDDVKLLSQKTLDRAQSELEEVDHAKQKLLDRYPPATSLTDSLIQFDVHN